MISAVQHGSARYQAGTLPDCMTGMPAGSPGSEARRFRTRMHDRRSMTDAADPRPAATAQAAGRGWAGRGRARCTCCLHQWLTTTNCSEYSVRPWAEGNPQSSWTSTGAAWQDGGGGGRSVGTRTSESVAGTAATSQSGLAAPPRDRPRPAPRTRRGRDAGWPGLRPRCSFRGSLGEAPCCRRGAAGEGF